MIYKYAISAIALVFLLAIVVVIGAVGGYFLMISRSSQNIGSKTTSSTATSSTSPLIVYSADAYVSEVVSLENGFSSQTGIALSPPKAGGSFLLAREIAQGNPVSVFFSVAKSAVSASYLNKSFSGWAIGFATDQMIIAYSNATLQDSAAKGIIEEFQNASTTNTTQAWFSFYSGLTSGFVKVGISNPNADPAGFRAWLVLQAAGHVYANNNSFFTDRILDNSGNITGASAADLIAPLQTGQIQFLFIYKSAAVSQNLKYFQLTSSVNLGNSAYTNFYSQFSYVLSSGIQSGAPILLFVTVPNNAINPSASLQFVVYTIQNSASMQNFGLTPLSSAVLYNDTSIPQPIQQLVLQGFVKIGGSL